MADLKTTLDAIFQAEQLENKFKEFTPKLDEQPYNKTFNFLPDYSVLQAGQELSNQIKEIYANLEERNNKNTITFLENMHALKAKNDRKRRLEDAQIELVELLKAQAIKPQAEALGDAVTGSQSQTKTTPLKQANNDVSFSGLLNIPQKTDDWFEVIDNMTLAFYSKNNAMPTKVQAWAILWESPPDGYMIKTGNDRGDECLKMPGNSNLSKRSFNERWKSYTKKTSG